MRTILTSVEISIYLSMLPNSTGTVDLNEIIKAYIGGE